MSKDAQQLAERLAGKGSTKHNYLIKKKYSGASKKVITASKKNIQRKFSCEGGSGSQIAM